MHKTAPLLVACLAVLPAASAQDVEARDLEVDVDPLSFTLTSDGIQDRLQWTFSVVTASFTLQRLAGDDLERAQWRLERLVEYDDNGDLSFGPADLVVRSFSLPGRAGSSISSAPTGSGNIAFDARIPLEETGQGVQEAGRLDLRLQVGPRPSQTATGPVDNQAMAIDVRLSGITPTSPSNRFALLTSLDVDGPVVTDLLGGRIEAGETSLVTLRSTPTPLLDTTALGLYQRAGQTTPLIELGPGQDQGIRFGASTFSPAEALDAIGGSPVLFTAAALGAVAVAGTPVWLRMRRG